MHPARRAGSARSEGWRLRKDGSRFWANISLTAIRDDNGTLRGFAKLTQDVTERMEAEASLKQANDALAEQIAARDVAVDALKREIAEREHAEALLRQAQKMEVLGQLTGGIAHDFNNMLMVIKSAAGLLRRRLSREDPDLTRFVESVDQGADRAASLNRRLLAFSRRQALEPKPTDVNKLISGL